MPRTARLAPIVVNAPNALGTIAMIDHVTTEMIARHVPSGLATTVKSVHVTTVMSARATTVRVMNELTGHGTSVMLAQCTETAPTGVRVLSAPRAATVRNTIG